MTIPFKVKLLTNTAQAPERASEGDLWDLFADNFSDHSSKALPNSYFGEAEISAHLLPMGRVLVKTGIAIALPTRYISYPTEEEAWLYSKPSNKKFQLSDYVVADLRPLPDIALRYGISILNAPSTIDNSYRKEVGIIIHNLGQDVYKIKRGDKIAQMLIRSLYPSSFEIVKSF